MAHNQASYLLLKTRNLQTDRETHTQTHSMITIPFCLRFAAKVIIANNDSYRILIQLSVYYYLVKSHSY